MTNNNINKYVPQAPKTYEVKHLNTEIPTYEEFLKTYWEDERVSASYQVEIDAQLPSYGPCDVCNKKEVTVEFKMICPASGCSNKEASFWVHNNDKCIENKNRMLISSGGILTCGGCATSHIMSNGKFDCSKHEGGYKSMDKKSGNKAMSDALILENVNSAIQDLSVYVANHKEKFGFVEENK